MPQQGANPEQVRAWREACISGASSKAHPASEDITGRTFSYDANGNQLGWTDDRNATYRGIEWDDAAAIKRRSW